MTPVLLLRSAGDMRLDENFLKFFLMRKCLSEDVRRCQQMSVIVREFLSESATSHRFAHCHGGVRLNRLLNRIYAKQRGMVMPARRAVSVMFVLHGRLAWRPLLGVSHWIKIQRPPCAATNFSAGFPGFANLHC